MKNKIKAVLLDLDGTLITQHRFYAVFNQELGSCRLPKLSRTTFDELFANNALETVIPSDLQARFWDGMLQNYSKMASLNERVIPGTREALHELKERGLLMGVVTGRITSVESIKKELEKHELNQFMDVVLTGVKGQNGEEDLFSKEQNLLEALDALGARPAESIFVGDYVADVQSGRKVGAVTVAVLTGGVKKEILLRESPDYILESVAGLPSLLAGHYREV